MIENYRDYKRMIDIMNELVKADNLSNQFLPGHDTTVDLFNESTIPATYM